MSMQHAPHPESVEAQREAGEARLRCGRQENSLAWLELCMECNPTPIPYPLPPRELAIEASTLNALMFPPHPLHPAAPEAWKFSAVASECLASEMSWHELRKKHVGRRSLDDADANLQGTKEPSLHGPSEGPLAPHLRLQVSSRLPRLGRLVAHTLGGKKCKLKRSLFEEVSWLKLWYR